jgi:DNA-binding LacI/PurR family transcriptional regulator
MDAIGVAALIDGGEVNVYFLEVLNGILEASAAHGQNITVFSIANWGAEAHRITGFCDGRVDGMILIAPGLAAPATLCHHTPFVTIHGNEAQPQPHNIDVDNEGGAYVLTRYLIEEGHTEIAHFPGSPDLIGARQRLAGFRRAIEEADLPFDERRVVSGNFSAWSGRQRAKQMLGAAGHAPLPTAIFCGSDAIAYGCMEVLEAAGIRVPADISIAGFDDTLTARMTRPPLTTVRQPFREMGRCAVETVLFYIRRDDDGAEPGDAEMPIRTFATELIVRESVAGPRGG